jgi:hypothetical protein
MVYAVAVHPPVDGTGFLVPDAVPRHTERPLLGELQRFDVRNEAPQSQSTSLTEGHATPRVGGTNTYFGSDTPAQQLRSARMQLYLSDRRIMFMTGQTGGALAANRAGRA